MRYTVEIEAHFLDVLEVEADSEEDAIAIDREGAHKNVVRRVELLSYEEELESA